MKNFIIIILILLFSSSLSKSDMKSNYVLNNMQQDFTTCYCYFKISEEGISRNKGSSIETINKTSKAADLALTGAFKLGEDLNMMKEAMATRIKMTFASLGNEMNNDYVNFSILIGKYGDLCKQLIENPESRMSYWMQKYKK